MKWHQIGEVHGYPIAFTWPTWADGDYYVARSRTDIESYRNGEQLSAHDAVFGMLGSLYFHWYEHDKWEPLFGFY